MPSKTSDYYFQSVEEFKMAIEKVVSDDRETVLQTTK